ncbi:MAG: phosphoadenylyl-sulfate reductase [Vicinamibacteria bacterium]
MDRAWTDAEAALLETEDPGAVLAWAAARFGGRIGFAFGFGPEGCVLFDLIARRRLPVDVFTLDTGLLFDETRDLWRRLEQRYGLTIRPVRAAQDLAAQARAHGERLWEREPDRCCALRKVAPLAEALADQRAWVSAIRRQQTAARAEVPVLADDPAHGIPKLSPLASWTREQVWDYLLAHDVPVNALHARGYPSIGCTPCTSAVAAGEDERAGRWRGRVKTECGLHTARRLPPAEPLSTSTEGAVR